MSEWQFDTSESGGIEGWFPAGLTTFRDRKLRNLVREILQNSLDNPAESDQDAPVIVKFSDKKIPREEIPGIDNLQDHLNMCVLASSGPAAPQHQKEVESALAYAKNPKIQTLLIEDFNTSGMSGGSPGPCEENSQFFTYIKTEGESGGDQTRGGSHGLGKNAPLISSKIRAIFASTCWVENGDTKSLLQGRCYLRTHNVPGQSNKKYVPRGYWGDDKFQPLTHCPDEYSWLARKKPGTTIAVLGWVPDENWEILIMGYAITSFFAAFQRGKLKIEVGKHTISQDNLEEHLQNTAIRDKFCRYEPDNAEEWELACALHACLANSDTIREEFQCKGKIGKGELRLQVFEGAPQKVAFIRSNILITDHIPEFYTRRHGALKDFVGVYECTNTAGLALLRGMEPPQHDDLKPDFLPTEERKVGQKGLKNLGEKLKELVKKHAQLSAIESIADKITLEFFNDDAGDGDDGEYAEDIDPEGNLRIVTNPERRPPPMKIPTEDEMQAEEDTLSDEEDGEEGGAGEGGGGGGHGQGHGTGHGSGTGGTGTRGRKRENVAPTLRIVSQRFIRKDINSGRVKFAISDPLSGNIEIFLQEVGADAVTEISLKEIEGCSGEFGKRGIVLENTDSGVFDFTFELKRPLLGGLKLSANVVGSDEI